MSSRPDLVMTLNKCTPYLDNGYSVSWIEQVICVEGGPAVTELRSPAYYFTQTMYNTV